MATKTSAVSYKDALLRGLSSNVSLETGHFSTTSSNAMEDWLSEKFPNAVDLKSNRKSSQGLQPGFAKKTYKDKVQQASTGKRQRLQSDNYPTISNEQSGWEDNPSESSGIEDIFSNVGHFSADEAVQAWLDKNFPEGKVAAVCSR